MSIRESCIHYTGTKLTNRGCRTNGFSALARKFKVSDVVIAHVANNTQWRHI